MADSIEKTLDIKDSGLDLIVEAFGEFVPIEKLKIDKDFFEKMCKEGCPKYGLHYGCPPGSPKFEDYTKGAKHFLVVMFCVSQRGKSAANFDEIEKVTYPKFDGLLRKLEKISVTKHIAARSCKLCEPCKRKLKQPCKYPEERRSCTVSLGIDCSDIAENIFHKPLVWQKGGNLKGYTSFIGLLPLKEIRLKDELVAELEMLLK